MSTIKVNVELQFDDDVLGDAPYEDVIPAAVQQISDLAHAHHTMKGMSVEIHSDSRAIERAVIQPNNPTSKSFGISYIPRYGADCDSFDDRDCECTHDQDNPERDHVFCNSSKCPKGTLWLATCGVQNYGGKRTIIRLQDVKEHGPKEAEEKQE